MLFDTRLFLYLFLPVSVLGFYALTARHYFKLSYLWLIGASFFFYSCWNKQHLALLILSVAFNFAAARLIAAVKHKRIILAAGIVFNLSFLIFFKYWHFLVSNLASWIPAIPSAAEISLPLGISFYTFTQIAYLVDISQKKTKPQSITDYALFVVFFPHLVAGPIVHYSHVMPQFASLRKKVLDYKNLFKGAFFFVVGLSEKILLADPLNTLANSGFNQAVSLNLLTAWKAVLAYSFQIYFDFAGYSNMAIGLALLFNIRFPNNFNSPYQAANIIDFWRRWHITLSEFLKNYVYIPLGGNRLGETRKDINIFLTMLIGGIWHGASWTFVFWGAYHGLLITLNHQIRRLKKPFLVLPSAASVCITFILVCIGWVFFKAENLGQAWEILQSLFGVKGFEKDTDALSWLRLAITGFIAFALPNAQSWEPFLEKNRKLWTAALCFLFIISYLTIGRSQGPNVFLYWQF